MSASIHGLVLIARGRHHVQGGPKMGMLLEVRITPDVR